MMKCDYELTNRKVVIVLFVWAVGVALLSTYLLPTPVPYLRKKGQQVIFLQHQLVDVAVNQNNMSKDLRYSSHSSYLGTERINASQVSVVDKTLKPEVVRFRELFNETYSSTVDTGPDNLSDSTRYLIYRCDGNTMKVCGGWADRLLGITTAYIIANLTGRVFKLEILSPSCDILQYIVPNHVNWSLPVSFHDVVRRGPDVRVYNKVDDRRFCRKISQIDFISLPEMKARYVYYKSNRECIVGLKASTRYKEQLSWMKNLTRAQIYAVLFKRLFKLSPQLQGKLNAFMATNLEPNDKLVCAQVRVGKNPTLPFDVVRPLKGDYLPQVWDFLRNFTKEPFEKIFLMSDSDYILSNSKHQQFKEKLIFTPGDVVHIERSRGLSKKEMCAGLEKVILEQFILMHCDILLVSNSGLSRMSVYVRGSDQGLYCLTNDCHIVPCQGDTLLELFGRES